MKKWMLFFLFFLALALAAYLFLPGKSETPESQYLAYCSSCHLAPDPAHIPRPVWEDRILPEMAARLGYKYSNYDPMAKNSMEENLYVQKSKTYPEEPAIDSMAWRQVHDYIIALAPESVQADTLRSQRNSESGQFNPIPLALDENEAAVITSIQFEPAGRYKPLEERKGGYPASGEYGQELKKYGW